jgi:predicted ATP-grasp superfamily ATP-dependent carboligase
MDVLAISKHRDKLERYYEFPIAKFNVIEKLVNKRKFYEMLEKLDVAHPKTYFPNNISDVKEISKEISYPYIVKPVFSTNFGREFSVKCFKANSANELIKAYNRASSSGHAVVIQEVIPGSDTNVYGFCSYFNCKFEPIGIFIYKKIRGCPEGFGLCCLVESIREPELIKIGTKLLQNLEYHGISEVEFKKNLGDDTFKIIEINARTWGENSLAARCGVDLSYMAYMDAIGGDVEKVVLKKEGVKWLYMFDDIRSSFKSMLKGELSFIEYINSLKGEKEYAIFAWDDPVPFIVSPFNISSAILKFLLKRLRFYVKSK